MTRSNTRACFAVSCLAGLALAFAQTADAAYQGPDRSKLRIGAYFLRVKPVVTDAHVRDMKDCGIDFVFDRFNSKFSDYMRFRNKATHFVGFDDGCVDLAGTPIRPVASLDAGSFLGLCANDGGKLIVGEMAARKDGGGDAVLICAADEPYDKTFKMRAIRFRIKDGCEVHAIGGQGPFPLTSAEDGTFSFKMSSSAGVLLMANTMP